MTTHYSRFGPKFAAIIDIDTRRTGLASLSRHRVGGHFYQYDWVVYECSMVLNAGF